MTAPVQATVTPEDREAADVPMGVLKLTLFDVEEHCALTWAIAQAIANAREAGRREAFGEALELVANHVVSISLKNRSAICDSIRAARDRALAEYGKAGA